MSPHFKALLKGTAFAICILIIAIGLSSCTTTLKILEGADGACGNIHVEGAATDTQGDIVIFKVPEGWTADEVKATCGIL